MLNTQQTIFTKYPKKTSNKNIEFMENIITEEKTSIITQNSTQIEDFLQNSLQLQNYSFLKDILLAIGFYLFYINVPTYLFTKTLQILFFIIIFRYILSLLTTYKPTNEESQKYFQYNTHIAFMYILILSYLKSNDILSGSNTFYLYYILLLCYSLLIIGSHHVYTSDAFTSIILTYYIFYYLNKSL